MYGRHTACQPNPGGFRPHSLPWMPVQGKKTLNFVAIVCCVETMAWFWNKHAANRPSGIDLIKSMISGIYTKKQRRPIFQ